ncbi:c-type cytochrome [Arundinibacter roseus]|uniref:Cytochrome c domain-containing protein n=1 Tax=Arundinibacter roseus TaxID=2070510 RepID=A0A4R4K045_9BACT|nr:hypothetical protein [Arundinibacter roseus]TDB60453.1 hypothetical protein EZE20_21220 [Arundinibacter roseus]
MVLKKLSLIVSFAIVGYVGVSCSSKEDQDSYDKYYGSGRAAREEAALNKGAEQRAEEVKVDPDTINSLSVTENMDGEVLASDATVNGIPETAGKTIEQVSEKKEEEAPKQKPVPADISALLNKHTCSACHRPYDRVVGPAYADVAKKNYSVEKIVELVYKPQPENWPGYPPMAPMTQVPKEDATKLAKWINSL